MLLKRIHFLFAIVFLPACFVAGEAGAQQKPHIVFYIADDAGYWDNSVYGGGEVKTPNLQKLAASGMKFNNAFVASPACAPSRAALLTGLMPARNGAEANHTYPTDDVMVLTKLLQQQGYEVAAFGKVAHDKMNFTAGFDFYSEPRVNLTNNIRAYLDTHKISKPLCLLVGDRRPHVPWTKNIQYNPDNISLPINFIDTKETRLERARYYTDVTAMDSEMGDVMQLAKKHFGSNTLYMFSSDHGAQWPFGKWNLYDWGIRTPLVISWPGKIAANSATDAMVSWVDIFPTLLAIAGATIPAGIDGKDFSKVLLGKQAAFREKIYTTHSGDGKMNVYPMRSVRNGQFHYIINLHPEYKHTNHSDLLQKDGAGSYWASWYAAAHNSTLAMAIVKKYHERPAQELYDVQADPFEQHNLADSPAYAALVKQMDADLRAWMKEQGDREKVYNEPILSIEALH